MQISNDSTQLYQVELPRVHAGIALRFSVHLRRLPLVGWQYQLLAFQVRSPTRAEVLYWLPLYRVIDGADFQPNVLRFH